MCDVREHVNFVHAANFKQCLSEGYALLAEGERETLNTDARGRLEHLSDEIYKSLDLLLDRVCEPDLDGFSMTRPEFGGSGSWTCTVDVDGSLYRLDVYLHYDTVAVGKVYQRAQTQAASVIINRKLTEIFTAGEYHTLAVMSDAADVLYDGHHGVSAVEADNLKFALRAACVAELVGCDEQYDMYASMIFDDNVAAEIIVDGIKAVLLPS